MKKQQKINNCKIPPYFLYPSMQNKEKNQHPIPPSTQITYSTPKKLAPSTDYCRVKHHNLHKNTVGHYFLHSQLLQFCDLPPVVRERMTVWVTDQATRRYLLRETSALAVALMDLYLVRNGMVTLKNVQELGIACLNLAIKFNQSSTRPIQFNTQVFSQQSINNFQVQVLRKTNFRLNPPNYSRISYNLLMNISQKISQANSPYQNLKSLNFIKSLQNLQQSPSNLQINVSKIFQFFELLDCSISVKELLEYEVEDFVYNCFVVFLRSCQSEMSESSLEGEEDDKENLAYQLEKFLNEIYLSTQDSPKDQLTEPPSICFDGPIQQLISITQSTLIKHRQLNPPQLLSPSLSTLQQVFPTYTLPQLLEIQTNQPYHLKVIKQSSAKISHLQPLFQI